MMKCDKTGLTEKDWKTILDVINVFDPNDIAHVYPSMSSPEFVQDVEQAFKAVLAHVNRSKYGSDLGASKVVRSTQPYVAEFGPNTIV